jgi:uncharacterized membrane protein YhfC
MSEFKNIVVSKSSVPALAITVVLLIVIPVALFIYWRRNHRGETNYSYLIAGAIGFIVSARVLELGVHYFCIISDNSVSRFITGNTLAYVLYGITMAGVFEECGRYIVMRFIMKKNRTRENAVMYGIGHGGIEILVVLLPAMISFLLIAVLFSTGDVNKALSTLRITEETAAASLPAIQAAASFSYLAMAMNVLERVFAMLLHIGLSVVVFYSVVSAKKIYLLLAILLHMLMDSFAALYQRGLLPMWATEIWAALWAAITVVIAFKLYKKTTTDTQTT